MTEPDVAVEEAVEPVPEPTPEVEAPEPTQAQDRARTYSGIANAMADEWGKI